MMLAILGSLLLSASYCASEKGPSMRPDGTSIIRHTVGSPPKKGRIRTTTVVLLQPSCWTEPTSGPSPERPSVLSKPIQYRLAVLLYLTSPYSPTITFSSSP